MVSRRYPIRLHLDLDPGLGLCLHLHLHMPENSAVVVAKAVLKIWHTTRETTGAEPPPTDGHLPSSPYCRPIIHHGSSVSHEGLMILTCAVHYILSPDIY